MAVLSDPVADFLTRIRNATKAQHRYVDVNWSKLKQNIAEILKVKWLYRKLFSQSRRKATRNNQTFLNMQMDVNL